MITVDVANKLNENRQRRGRLIDGATDRILGHGANVSIHPIPGPVQKTLLLMTKVRLRLVRKKTRGGSIISTVVESSTSSALKSRMS